MPKNPFLPLYEKIPKPFRNRYFLVLVLFFMWLIFFDKHDVLTQFRLQQTADELSSKKEFYKEKIKQVRQDRADLFTNTKSIEKFAREKYLMKKDDEDVFVIIEE